MSHHRSKSHPKLSRKGAAPTRDQAATSEPLEASAAADLPELDATLVDISADAAALTASADPTPVLNTAAAATSAFQAPPRGTAMGISLLAGATRGLLATGAMSATMSAGHALGWLGEPPPRRIVRKTARKAAGRAPAHNNAVAVAAHFAMGASFGLAHALLLRRRSDSLAAGVLFGAAVWGLSYGGVLPAAGIMPTPANDKPGRPATMLLAHLVFGASLAALSRATPRL